MKTERKAKLKKVVNRVSPHGFFFTGKKEGLSDEVILREAARLFPDYSKLELKTLLKCLKS
jgi:hypothetical protein